MMTVLVPHPRQFRFRLLLGSLLILLVVSPLRESGGWGDHALAVAFAAVMVAAVFAVVDNRFTRTCAILLAGVWLVVQLAALVGESDTLVATSRFVLVPFLVMVGYHVLRAIIEAEAVSLDIVAGGVAIYLMLAIVWAVTFSIIEFYAPGSFAFGQGTGADAWEQLLYFSLTTITTLGYGDIHPVTPLAKIWSTLEAAMGVIYMAVLMARLVSLYQR